MIATYAADPRQSRGRRHPEAESATRTPFQRDRDRIIHSGAFRKLEYKTQVFVYHVGDYYRTRLTHSLEVAQIARSICRVLGGDEDLAEAIALAHDLGHTPFGHAGEAALQTAMADCGGFDHNDQTVRTVTRLEQRYAEFDGLNLTWETIEGLVKHNGPPDAAARARLPTILALDGDWPLDLNGHPGLEAQIAAIADDVAYNNHDIDDGLRAGLFQPDELRDLPLVGACMAEVEERYGRDLHRRRFVHETVRRLIDRMVGDLISETRLTLQALAIGSAADIRAAGRPVVAFSAGMEADQQHLRAFLFNRMYRDYRTNRETSKARRVIAELFALFVAEPGLLPTEWQPQGPVSAAELARTVCDYIAGMTDRYALLEHQRLFAVSASL
ncbi:MAG: deoxyguanosinetriphosphate triphosphohydrolase [Rhodospirillaceae bacterium]|nr:deoxyguanosinetriphosphate triphosphohydrolase [Rhodospirillaceae bacterium]MCA8930996.1 deoxyguanosinetriphosphate triphosphohydrolase [Rhodospirillaceae bacterium]